MGTMLRCDNQHTAKRRRRSAAPAPPWHPQPAERMLGRFTAFVEYDDAQWQGIRACGGQIGLRRRRRKSLPQASGYLQRRPPCVPEKPVAGKLR